MARWRQREWKDGPGGRWLYKIVWFQGTEPDDVRLRITNLDYGERNIYPRTTVEAEQIFADFRADPTTVFVDLWERFRQAPVEEEVARG